MKVAGVQSSPIEGMGSLVGNEMMRENHFFSYFKSIERALSSTNRESS